MRSTKFPRKSTSAGGKVETVQKMDKKNFARVADKKYSAGFYANVIFTGTPAIVTQLQHQVRAERGCVPRAVHPVARTETREITKGPVMANFNKVILAGNLTRDPELRYTPKGTAIARITLAVNRTWKSESGEKKEEVSFVDVDVWGRQAEVIAQYMKKGRPLLVEGRLKLDKWEDKNTKQKQSKLKVVLESFSFIDSNRGDSGGSGSAEAPRSRPAATSPAPAPEGGEADAPPERDDVPF